MFLNTFANEIFIKIKTKDSSNNIFLYIIFFLILIFVFLAFVKKSFICNINCPTRTTFYYSNFKLIKYHNLIFKNKKKIIVELGVDRGASLLTLFKFAENNSTIIGIDVFEGLKKNNISKFDKYYEKGDLNRQNYQYLFDKCKKLSNEKKKVILFKGFFPNLKKRFKIFKKKKLLFCI